MATIETYGNLLQTRGLAGVDLTLRVSDPGWTPDGEALLRTIIEYVEQSGRQVRDGETFAYGYWLVQFRRDSDGRLEIWETTAEATDRQRGAELTLEYWRAQHQLFERHHMPFESPRPDQKVAVSVGVYENDPVQGVRYPAPPHMSGWYLTTNRYNGDINTLSVEHLYHLTAARPDLAQYVALPPGCRFDTSVGEDVWFDPDAAAESS